MNDEDRPNPEELLEIIKREETQSRKGKLKIFLGMAAGVGKTYAMLEAAQKLRKEGVDVVIGCIDTHGRPETEKLLEGMKVIPQKWINYKDTVFEELDIDEIIKLKPQLVLIDELAHSNVPGSRHPKRWQDVAEILDDGIDVYTTLNVQHIESLKDVMEKITGIVIRETVPDLVVETSTNIELVDITPNELLQRLKEGKVYLGDQSAIAARHFFQEDRLTALREIVLRYAAEKIDHDLKGMTATTQRVNGWKPRERLLVAVSHSPHSQKLIRITRRLAFTLDAPWIAVHVDDGTILDENDHAMLDKNIALARDLGAEVITTSDTDIAQGIQRIARQKSVSQIIIGRPPKRPFFDFFQRNTLLDRITRDCSDIDVHVIRQTLLTKAHYKKWQIFHYPTQLAAYLQVTCFVLLLTAFNWFFVSIVGYKLIGLIFLLGILFLSLFFKKGPIFFASILSAVIWNFLFIPHEGDIFGMSDDDTAFLVFYLLTAIVTGILTDRARKNKEMLIKRERSIRALYEIVREIAGSSSMENLLQSVKERLGAELDGRCEIILKELDGGLIFDKTQSLISNDKEKAAANWVFQNGKEAGWSTSTLPSAQNLYIPLRGFREMVGVIAYHSKRDRTLTIEEKNFLYNVAQQLGNHLERSFVEERARKQENLRQTETVYQSILNLVSNLFESPLLTIQEAVKELIKEEHPKKTSITSTYLEQIESSSESLTHILENVTAMAHLSAGLTPISKKINSMEKLVCECIENIKKSTNTHHFSMRIQKDLPKIPFDYDLIELLFYNLVFNSIEYSPAQSTIEIESHLYGDHLVLSVADEGQGIPPDMIESVFEKFYRVPGTSSSGLGLGLAIAKTIAEIHGGRLKAQNREMGGSIFSLFLPVK